MANLAGLPDFAAAASSDEVQMYAPFAAGSFSVLPRQIDIAQDASGRPKFELAIVKTTGDTGAGGQYTALDLELAGDFPLDEALEAARLLAADATVHPANINLGFARLYPTTQAVALPADLTTPTPLGWSAPGSVRWTRRLSVDTGEMIKGALSGGALLFGARVEFDVIGVSPRLPAVVQFAPAQLIAAVAANAPGRQIANADLVAFFRRPIEGLPLKLNGTNDPERFPQAMADRVIAAYGTLVPAPKVDDPPFIALADPAALDAATVTWDLGQAAAVPRQWAMTLDPLTSLRAAAQRSGIDSLVKYITVPPLDVGLRSIDITANLPRSRVGIPAIGVNIAVPAHPPARPNAVHQTVTFAPPDDEGSVKFRLSPGEPLACTIAGFAVVATGGSVHEYDAPPKPSSAPWIHLQAPDFPVTFAHLTAADRLLKLASLAGTLSYSVDGKALHQPFTLTAAQPDVALALPAAAADASIALSATASGAAPVAAPAMAPGRIALDVTSFREYGPHRINIQCGLSAGDPPLALDLVSEENAGDPTAVSTIVLTADAPQQTWGYVASSPFHGGYRYRRSAAPDAAPAAWSPVLSPFAPLNLNPDATPAASSNPGTTATFDIDGTHYYGRTDQPDTLYYLPGAPVPELDARGRSTLMLIRTAQSAILQFGAQFTLGASEQAAALVKIGKQQPAFASASLQPAPIRVDKVTASLADASGNLVELKSAVSSSFPPYATVFSIMLTPDQAAQATSSINGRAGVLVVDYAITLPPAVAATLQGAPTSVLRRADVADWFAAGEGTTHLKLAG